ncbi:hypothetical protein [uncultured Slackia sp.]|uniref:hypothetical protein n=1 Tax=uncultured Slackia sp. TaxID=665903 RepID=UPI002588FD88|nr:hypothetical protein [uncultured Slackia sp.]
MNSTDLTAFFDDHNYDIRSTHNGCWIDQKCTMDVVCFVAGQIVDYLEDGGDEPFTKDDIWKYQGAIDQVQMEFTKPDPLAEQAHDEYNKFYRQTMKMLSAAGVLNESGKKRIQFSVVSQEMLEYIAKKDVNALLFLCGYIEKTLKDSGIWHPFSVFFEKQDGASFGDLKNAFAFFEIANTPKNTATEVNRIFTKVINPLAFRRNMHGTIRGKLSANVITKSDIIYNRPNWRDEFLGKDKNVARRQFVRDARYDYKSEKAIAKAMEEVRKLNTTYRNGRSEVLDWDAYSPANAAHHMFPKGQRKEIASYRENLIMLTASQHMGSAHPNGKTTMVDLDYQYRCLVSKLRRMKEYSDSADYEVSHFYDLERFAFVLDVGLDTDYFKTLPVLDFSPIENGLDLFYPDHPAMVVK